MQLNKKTSIVLIFAMAYMLLAAAPAFAADDMQLNFVPPFNGQQMVQAGSNVTLQAAASNAAGYGYYVLGADQDWMIVDSGQSGNLTLNDVKPGTYIIDMYPYGLTVGIREMFNVDSSVSLNVTSNADGTCTATANARNLGCYGSEVWYAFYSFDGTNYTLMGDGYSASNTAIIPSGAKQVIVYAKDKQAPLKDEMWKTCVADVAEVSSDELEVISIS
ncbi:hypothetical protein [Desulfoscipio gibsoniae]|uniref:Uncharacterized protein n=1 Tax=Desulfoscipio gibsoniae DSM 7213 TaxID=767817 RepID=R4KVY0_9FIRM|nr:hypothetical protein [Desulfoscipio gibsoniae]AGL03781.1 hypothetical protein Desgi_4554 [Desulfoscipio gibsoniae DSM 7213]